MIGRGKCRTFVSKLKCVILEASILLKPQESKNSEKNDIICTLICLDHLI